MESGWVRKSRNGVTIVFIHGILGTERTWQNPNGNAWPLLVCDEETLDSYGVYLFNYRADAFSGTFSIQDAVDNLNERFNIDDVFLQHSIVFVCHSMGGIVARHFVVTQQARLIQAKTKIGLFLVASPSLGSEYANFVATIAALYNAQLNTLKIGQENTWLSTLDRTFIDLKERDYIPIFGKELIEDNSIALRRFLRRQQIVQPFSGARYFGDSIKIENSDHLSIAKPADRSAIQHRLLVKFLMDFFKEVDNAVTEGGLEGLPRNPVLLTWPAGPVVTSAEDEPSHVEDGADPDRDHTWPTRRQMIIGSGSLAFATGTAGFLAWNSKPSKAPIGPPVLVVGGSFSPPRTTEAELSSAIGWFYERFGPIINPRIEHTPLALPLIAAIAVNETYLLWGQRRGPMPTSEILALCVGDTLDAPYRSAFPKTRADLQAAPRGSEMFTVAREALERLAGTVPGYSQILKNPDKFVRSFGIFAYDLQFFQTDPDLLP